MNAGLQMDVAFINQNLEGHQWGSILQTGSCTGHPALLNKAIMGSFDSIADACYEQSSSIGGASRSSNSNNNNNNNINNPGSLIRQVDNFSVSDLASKLISDRECQWNDENQPLEYWLAENLTKIDNRTSFSNFEEAMQKIHEGGIHVAPPLNGSRELDVKGVMDGLLPLSTTMSAGQKNKIVAVKCEFCNKKFTSEKYLSMHLALHKNWNVNGKHQGGGSDPGESGSNVDGMSQPQWICQVCGKTFAQNSNYKNHVRTHSNERPFVCDICSIGFKERYHLKKHTLFKHTRELNEQCGQCGKRFKDSTAVRAHERIHSDARPYSCLRCGKAFKTSECLWHHDHRSKTCGRQAPTLEVGRTVCDPRQLSETPRQQRQQQQQQQQNGVLEMQKCCSVTSGTMPKKRKGRTAGKNFQKVEIVVPGRNVRSDQEWACDVVSEKQDFPAEFMPDAKFATDVGPAHEAHLSPDHFFQIPVSHFGIVSTRSNISYDNNKSELVPTSAFRTQPCGTKAPTSRPVQSRRHDNPTNARSGGGSSKQQKAKLREICSICGKHFVSTPAFQKHMLMHSEARPYRCPICDIGFKLKVHLKKHNLYKHNDDYPCKCRVCGKRFKDSSAVRLHERIHSNERPFQCQCGKSFKTRENLWGHRHRRPCMKYVVMDSQRASDVKAKHRPRAEKCPAPPLPTSFKDLTGSSNKDFQYDSSAWLPIYQNGNGGIQMKASNLGNYLEVNVADSKRKENISFISNKQEDNVAIIQPMFNPDHLAVDTKPCVTNFRSPFDKLVDSVTSPFKTFEPIKKDLDEAPPSSLNADFNGCQNNNGCHNNNNNNNNNTLPPFETLISALRNCVGLPTGNTAAAAATIAAATSGYNHDVHQLLADNYFFHDRVIVDDAAERHSAVDRNSSADRWPTTTAAAAPQLAVTSVGFNGFQQIADSNGIYAQLLSNNFPAQQAVDPHPAVSQTCELGMNNYCHGSDLYQLNTIQDWTTSGNPQIPFTQWDDDVSSFITWFDHRHSVGWHATDNVATDLSLKSAIV